MCIGIPMQVLEVESGFAVCEGMGETRKVDTVFLREVSVGAWVLVFLDSARQVLTEGEARQLSDGLRAVELVMEGNRSVDHLFSDLVNREPPLPEHLRSLVHKSET
ncbi:MAG: HypC/HybG/HupF family hydrogenase formation chaperone [Gammaproteobacteria bacterium]|nr:HypC/HybG/HupF family hydrogenase formation chaperone [Gammaproteobacteria bacterium]